MVALPPEDRPTQDDDATHVPVNEQCPASSPWREFWTLYWILAAVGFLFTLMAWSWGSFDLAYFLLFPMAYWALFGWPLEVSAAIVLVFRHDFRWYDAVAALAIGAGARVACLGFLWRAAMGV